MDMATLGTYIKNAIVSKVNALTFKTINNEVITGTGNIEIGGGGGETVNIETLTADKTLTAEDATVQIYTSTANRQIQLPTTWLNVGHKFVFVNNYTIANVS